MEIVPDISLRLGGIKLRNPFIVGAGPTVKNTDQIKKARDSGWAAVSMKLVMEPAPYINHPPRYRWFQKKGYHIFTAEKRLSTPEGLKLFKEARRIADELVIIPTIAYAGNDRQGWVRLAQRFADEGASLIELNMCCPNMSFNTQVTGKESNRTTGASLGSDLSTLSEVVRSVAGAVGVPVIVKLTPEGGSIARAAKVCLEAGAAAVGGTANRLGIPDIDIRKPTETIYRLQEKITLGCLSGPWIRPLALRDTYEMRMHLGEEAFLLAAGGIKDLPSAVQQIMAGADALWICTATMIRGFGWLSGLLDELIAYMREMGYGSLRDMRGLLLDNIVSAGDLRVYPGYAVVDREKCISCGLCWELGHCTALTHPGGVTTIDRGRCQGCSTCVDVCPQGAIRMTNSEGIHE